MFALTSDITIGRYASVKPNEVKISRSLFEYVDKATIKLPVTARIVRAGGKITQSAETAKQFTEGDPVTIRLGYNLQFETEFIGFVSRVDFASPVQLQCEGYSYQLKKNTYQKTFVKAQLRDILKFLVQGTDIILDSAIPSFVIDKLIIERHSGTEVLELIKKISSNTIRFYFTGKVLYAGLQFLKGSRDVKFRLGWNVIKDNNLKLREAKNQDVVINFLGEKKDGSTHKATAGKHRGAVVVGSGKAGSTGETKTIKTFHVTDASTLKAMAEAKLSQLKYDGYEGKITAFLQPYCEPGYRAILKDEKYPERSGNYIITTIEVTYGMSGARRIVGIGNKL